MDLLETSTQSFIVKIWIEETAAEAGSVTWRGHVTHVDSGERHYFEDPDEMVLLMEPYLGQIGIDFAQTRPFLHWWHRWRQFLAARRPDVPKQVE